MNILFLYTWYPDPPDNGSKLRVRHLLKALDVRDFMLDRFDRIGAHVATVCYPNQ